MSFGVSVRFSQIIIAVCLRACCIALPAIAQQPPAPASQSLQDVVVTGSRILQNVAQSTQPLSVISSDQIEKTGLASVGDLLQQLTTGGSALNAKFNSSGNFGYPPDGGGIGAGSSQVDLRNLDSKRTLVLVEPTQQHSSNSVRRRCGSRMSGSMRPVVVQGSLRSGLPGHFGKVILRRADAAEPHRSRERATENAGAGVKFHARAALTRPTSD